MVYKIITIQFVSAVCLRGRIYRVDIPVLMLPVCWGGAIISHVTKMCMYQSAQQTAHTPFDDMLPHLKTLYNDVILLNVQKDV
jgi:hypothetical protein